MLQPRASPTQRNRTVDQCIQVRKRQSVARVIPCGQRTDRPKILPKSDRSLLRLPDVSPLRAEGRQCLMSAAKGVATAPKTPLAGGYGLDLAEINLVRNGQGCTEPKLLQFATGKLVVPADRLVNVCTMWRLRNRAELRITRCLILRESANVSSTSAQRGIPSRLAAESYRSTLASHHDNSPSPTRRGCRRAL